MPIFRPGPGPYALAVTMTGIRMGERLLYVGSGTPPMFGALAAKVGLSGQAAGVATERGGKDALEGAGAEAGALVEAHAVLPSALPFEADAFDLVVIDRTRMSMDDARKWLPETRRVLRHGGRLIIVERAGTHRLWGVFPLGSSEGRSDAAAAALSAQGFRPVRKIAEREGWRFTEGLKPRTA